MTDPALERGDSSGLGVRELLRAISERSLEPLAATEHCLDRIAAHDGGINAFVWVDTDGAIETAAERGRQLHAGIKVGPLHGLPIAVKELVDVAGAPSEYSSQTRLGERAADDATVVRLLRRAGAVVIGTTRSHEFGWGITTQHSLRGGTRNPCALDRVPGGSSGGAAAAVAAGMVPACVATDTGGSIRIPSAFCGVAGIKPTFGTVPRRGVVPLAPSLDTVGVIARRVDDLWPVLSVMSGVDDEDWRTWSGPPLDSLRGRTIGIAPRLVGPFADSARLARYENAVDVCGRFGVRVTELSTPTAEDFRAVFALIQGFEAVQSHTTTLGLYPAHKSSYGADVAGRLDWASGITETEYRDAKRQAETLTSELTAALQGADALLTPVALVAAPFLDTPDTVSVDGVLMATRDAIMGFTVPQNVAGLPTVTFRAGLTPDALPFGLQVTCAKRMDRSALGTASLLERLLEDRLE